MDDYSRVVGGALPLKKSTKGKLFKAKSVATPASNNVAAASSSSQVTSAPKVVKVTSKKTATELAAEKARQRIHAERLKEQAKKSHKDRVTEFNEKLAKLSEHHDIPKVGPG